MSLSEKNVGVNYTHQKYKILKRTLLLFVILSSPLICCSATLLLDALPPSLLPPAIDFTVNLFESEVQVENLTSETLYVTPVTTTRGEPEIIMQSFMKPSNNIPLAPNRTMSLQYDSADMPLSEIVVCKQDGECGVLGVDNSRMYSINSFENFKKLDPNWLAITQASHRNNFGIDLFSFSGLVPIILFLSWLYLIKLEKKNIKNSN